MLAHYTISQTKTLIYLCCGKTIAVVYECLCFSATPKRHFD